MGCVSCKHARSDSTPLHSGGDNDANGSGNLRNHNDPEKEESIRPFSGNLKSSKRSNSSGKKYGFSFNFGRVIKEGENQASEWPDWLTTVAGEAIEGWIPLRSDKFEKLEKIGQGTYSSVYRARNVESGKMFALKKVRFDNFQPESVRFMAREITILRKLDHPNIMKLEGIITSRLSCSLYLVFEYMEHDLSGLLSCPDIKFTDTQIKCYMRQLLNGLEHCHSRGIMHRDLKSSNILLNNEGILKIADFGLANFLSARNKQPLTSRVVTLWYRPPELLLGSTNYGVTVDMWSAGCVFGELFFGRPLLKGRTEVEQLHKIFLLCGSPPEDYWKKSKLPLAAMFKPQHPYDSTLRDRCKELPKSAVDLIETILSFDPHKRGTASSALDSEYFNTKPYDCEPSSLPKYPPNKEIDAKIREEARRKRASSTVRASGRNSRKIQKPHQEARNYCKMGVDTNNPVAHRINAGSGHISKGKGATVSRMSMKPSYDTASESSQLTEESQESIRSVPVQITASSGFAWAKKGKNDSASTRIFPSIQKSSALGTSSLLQDILESDMQDDDNFSSRIHTEAGGHNDVFKHSTCRQNIHHERPDSFDSSDIYQSQDLSVEYDGQQGRVGFSGPLLYQSQRFDVKNGSQTRQAGGHRSRFHRDS